MIIMKNINVDHGWANFCDGRPLFWRVSTEGCSLYKRQHKEVDVFVQVLALFSGTIWFVRNEIIPKVLI